MIKENVTRLKSGAIELTTSWEVLFNPLKSCRERVGGIDQMMTEIEGVLHAPGVPSWHEDVGVVGHFDKSIRFSWEPPHLRASTFCPTTIDRFQDWIMEMMQEMGYEGWSVVDRVVTAQANDE